MNNTPSKPRRPWLSGILTLLMPGLGQVYNGNARQGLVTYLFFEVILGLLIIAWAYLLPSFTFLVVLVMAVLIGWVGISVFAYRQAKTTDPELHLKWYSRWHGLLGIFLLSILIGEYAEPARQLVQTSRMAANSMLPTLMSGDHLIIQKAYYGIKSPLSDEFLIVLAYPKRGDLIIFKYPEDERKNFIKRVIGLPGDTVEVKNKEVYINSELLTEPYVIHVDETNPVIPKRDNLSPVTVPADSYFVMGDNRDQSLDSRFWGFVQFNKIKGKASSIYLSFDKDSRQIRWERFGKTLE